MTETREDLIKRLEGAEGPDRELDCLIYARAIGLTVEERDSKIVGLKDGIATLDFGYIDPGKHQRNFTIRSIIAELVPDYTSSIDAALTLVPDGFESISSHFTPSNGVYRVDMGDETVGDEGEFAGRHSVPAIALCIAALKAMEGK